MHIEQAKQLKLEDFRGHADTRHSEMRMFIDGELCNTRSG